MTDETCRVVFFDRVETITCSNLAGVIAQRDKLAEALREIEMFDGSPHCAEIAHAALKEVDAPEPGDTDGLAYLDRAQDREAME